ncbi:hypothetical protein PPERSA_07331 [Pseudocohnilembus persalinus]|uniref:Uncharacterized protein n=1 Tax=Pseudocohnilembus persalinus TaxID=266149 RepID=A0A0V0QA15_PSEPJ|nr:hypothetical protein PPERSA_07331 [Pseudocohnilembus persalinus]|eukprot:KRW99078.1 hypothetical protein PPERSA_07331 [Pseudocohnilembus persalinus]
MSYSESDTDSSISSEPEDMDSLMKKLKNEIKQTKSTLQQFKEEVAPGEGFQDENNQSQYNQQQNIYKATILKQEPAFTFSRSKRFKEEEKPEKEELNLSQTSFLSVTSANDLNKRSKINVIIPKAERFSQKKQIDERDYQEQSSFIQKRAPTIKINPENKKEKVKTNFKGFLQNQSLASSYMDDLETEASMYEPGPGAYSVNYSAVESVRQTKMPIAKRFQDLPKDERSILNPNYQVILKQMPSTVIKNQVQKSKQYQKVQKEMEEREIQAAKIQLQAPLEKDSYLKRNIGTAILKSIDDAPIGSRERRYRLFYLLDKLKEQREGAPGQYNENHGPELDERQKKKLEGNVMAAFRSHSSERRVPDNYHVPGPDYYYCKDDLCVENAPAFTFAKEQKEKEPEPDRRLPLDIKEDLIKKRILGGNINKEHQEIEETLQDIIEKRMGPGAYEQSYKLVEKRNDIGVQKFADLNEKNDRENKMEHLKQFENFDNEDLNPNIEAIKPNIKGNVKLHEPSDVQPQHPSDNMLFPEKWQFYDGNLDSIKEKIGQPISFAGNKDRDEFLEHEDFMNLMKAYFDRQKKMPEGYDVSYKQIDKKLRVPDLQKNLAKDLLDPIEKPEGDYDGDNLILNPDKPKKRLPNINLKLQKGRDLEEIQEKREEYELNGEELHLSPKKPEKKIKGAVDFKKQVQRPNYEQEIEEKREADTKPPLDPELPQKIKGAVQIDKYARRPEGPQEKEQEVIVDVKTTQTKPRVKGDKEN